MFIVYCLLLILSGCYYTVNTAFYVWFIVLTHILLYTHTYQQKPTLSRRFSPVQRNRHPPLGRSVRSEFGRFMELMGISFSVKKWKKIFKEIDRNYDNEISLNEFLLFLYPDHDVALSQENKRLKVISQRVMDRANTIFGGLTRINSGGNSIPSPAATTSNDAAAANAASSSGGRPLPSRASSISTALAQSAAARRSSLPKIHPDMSRLSFVKPQ